MESRWCSVFVQGVCCYHIITYGNTKYCMLVIRVYVVKHGCCTSHPYMTIINHQPKTSGIKLSSVKKGQQIAKVARLPVGSTTLIASESE